MATQTENQPVSARAPLSASGVILNDGANAVQYCETDIVCQYGVVVRCTSVAGMDLVEFEFQAEAA